jgi:hypothetical protein
MYFDEIGLIFDPLKAIKNNSNSTQKWDTLNLALCILKDNAQLLFNLTIKVVFESCLKSMLMILSGRFICGVLNHKCILMKSV